MLSTVPPELTPELPTPTQQLSLKSCLEQVTPALLDVGREEGLSPSLFFFTPLECLLDDSSSFITHNLEIYPDCHPLIDQSIEITSFPLKPVSCTLPSPHPARYSPTYPRPGSLVTSSMKSSLGTAT